ncbi:MAG: hypothetical protein K2L52_06725 [Clostridia bacterium]|nr:hypothetical protein [Clostridia bacterium]
MELHANENIHEDEAIVGKEEASREKPDCSSNKRAPIENKKYGKKFSARIYKFFSLFMFFIYYFNCMVRIVSNCVKYFKSQGVNTFLDWLTFTFDTTKWGEISRAIFDWYTITLLIFLILYLIVFTITFIRYSPKHKKTFKFFKKGFVMARRLIKLISVGLTLTVLVKSAQLNTFGDKFMFVISLLAMFVTVIQIFISVATWIWGRKLNRSVKQYVGNVMSSYIATARVRPNAGVGKKTVGDKLGKAKDRFLRTIEAMTLTKEEAMQKDAELEGYVVENYDITERFENDYQPSVEELSVEEKSKKSKKPKHNTKKVKRVTTKKGKTDKNKENHESTT